jgi:hypothetical protein
VDPVAQRGAAPDEHKLLILVVRFKRPNDGLGAFYQRYAMWLAIRAQRIVLLACRFLACPGLDSTSNRRRDAVSSSSR